MDHEQALLAYLNLDAEERDLRAALDNVLAKKRQIMGAFARSQEPQEAPAAPANGTQKKKAKKQKVEAAS